MAAVTSAHRSARAMAPRRAAPAVCELEGPTITGPMMSRTLDMLLPYLSFFLGFYLRFVRDFGLTRRRTLLPAARATALARGVRSASSCVRQSKRMLR